MADKDFKEDVGSDLMHHPEHMCSLRKNSCGNVSRAQAAEAAGVEGRAVSGKAPDICTPFVGGA